MVWHIPENETAGTPYLITVTTPGAASGARSTVVSGWPAGWTDFPKIVSALRAGVLLGNLEVTAEATGTLTISGVIDGYADFALAVGDTLDLRPSKLALTEVQDAIDATGASVLTKADDTAVVHLAGTETITGTKTFSDILTAAAIKVQSAGSGFVVTRRDTGAESWQFYDPNTGFNLYNSALASNALLVDIATNNAFFGGILVAPGMISNADMTVNGVLTVNGAASITGKVSVTLASVPDAADDAAAAALSPAIVVGGFYRTGSVLKIRVS